MLCKIIVQSLLSINLAADLGTILGILGIFATGAVGIVIFFMQRRADAMALGWYKLYGLIYGMIYYHIVTGENTICLSPTKMAARS